MSDWKEENIRRRDVRSGIGLEKERGIRGNVTQHSREWFVVYFYRKYDRHGIEEMMCDGQSKTKWGPLQIAVWSEHRSEAEAKAVVEKEARTYRGWGYKGEKYDGPYCGGGYKQFYCHRLVFEKIKATLDSRRKEKPCF